MAQALHALKELSEREQAVYFHSRERRRSLLGVPEMYRSHQFLNTVRSLAVIDATNATPIVITTPTHGLVTGMTETITGVLGNTAANGTFTVTVLSTTTFSLDTSVGNGAYISGGEAVNASDMPVPLIDTDAVLPDRDLLITFKTAIRILAGTGGGNDEHRGLVFEFGGAATGVALWVGDQTLGFHAGDDGTVDGATALFDNSVELPEGLELDLVAAVRPGDGRIRVWANGRELVRSTASGEELPNGWADTDNGSFAAVPSGTIVSDVPAISQVAPSGFEVIEPLSIYQGQVPRHFI